MGPFDYIQKKGSKPIAPQPALIRREIIATASHGTSGPQKGLVPRPSLSDSCVTIKNGRTAIAKVTAGDLHSKSRSHSARKRGISAQSRLESDSSEDDNDDTDVASHTARKRPNLGLHDEIDMDRQVYNERALVNGENDAFAMVHAADIATIHNSTKYKAAFSNTLEARQVYLQYPSASKRERYELVSPVQKDDFKPLEDIKEVLQVVINYYLPAAEAAVLNDESHGLIRKVKRAMDKQLEEEYVELICEWNKKLTKFVQEGIIEKALRKLKTLDLKLVEWILTQTYSRTVSLHVRDLSQYENGTDNVYGELLPKFISNILKKDTRLKSNQIFVDLGSGVGNVVLQAALEIGCESWGCEMMDKACNLAELQEQEFRARCRLWGLAAGTVHLERGDFLKNAAIGKILRKADVVLVNNQAFTPELNEDLTSLFLDLKEGCQIVSLKSFVPSGHKITSRNLDSPRNVLNVTEKRYFSACVSWTDAPGTYYISVKDRSKLLSFTESLKTSEPTVVSRVPDPSRT